MVKQIIQKILPKEDKFHRLIGKLTAETTKCAGYLKTFVDSDDPAVRKESIRLVNESRMEAKQISADITRQLCSTFITPFDREDIQDFSLSLYKITKTIKKICDRLDIHEIKNEKGDLSKQTDLIIEEAQAMDDMVSEIISGHDTKRIVRKVNVLHDLENKGDIVLGELLGALFREHTDARTLILRKDIYDMLEKVIDRYRDAAAVALQIVLKHS